MPPDDPGEQPHGGAGVCGIEGMGRRRQAANAAAGDVDDARTRKIDISAECADARERGRAVRARRVAGNVRRAIGQCAEQGVAM
jgi:hypothetical protein